MKNFKYTDFVESLLEVQQTTTGAISLLDTPLAFGADLIADYESKLEVELKPFEVTQLATFTQGVVTAIRRIGLDECLEALGKLHDVAAQSLFMPVDLFSFRDESHGRLKKIGYPGMSASEISASIEAVYCGYLSIDLVSGNFSAAENITTDDILRLDNAYDKIREDNSYAKEEALLNFILEAKTNKLRAGLDNIQIKSIIRDVSNKTLFGDMVRFVNNPDAHNVKFGSFGESDEEDLFEEQVETSENSLERQTSSNSNNSFIKLPDDTKNVEESMPQEQDGADASAGSAASSPVNLPDVYKATEENPFEKPEGFLPYQQVDNKRKQGELDPEGLEPVKEEEQELENAEQSVNNESTNEDALEQERPRLSSQ